MKLISILLVLASLLSACSMKEFPPVFISSKTALDYPSGSTIAYLSGKFFVMGDDAAEILVLNAKLDEIERIAIFPKGISVRLPKTLKADIEASVVLRQDGIESIIFMGSGSFSPQRDTAFSFNPISKLVKRMDMTAFYDQIRVQLSDLNIEAATSVGNNLLIGVRANRSHPDNNLVMAKPVENSYQVDRKIKIQLSIDQAGISGMDYDEKGDVLFITFSTEDTVNSYDDGEIGESYLAIIPGAKLLLQMQSLNVTSLIKLSDIHAEFKNQKIESVSLTGEDRKLLLVADDDQGNTKFFEIKF